MANETNNPNSIPQQPNCLACEAMLTDALDRTLSPAEQTAFDLHIQTCTACADTYAEAQRGVAWLEMLKTPRPQPRPELLASILAQTSGAQTSGAPLLHLQPTPAPVQAGVAMPGRVLSFRPQAHAPRPTTMHRLGRLLLEPRLAMTAAMAFFSITLTMSLTGVRLNDLHAGDLNPLNLRRTVHTAQAGAIRYYDNLRVVHVLESRVDDVRENLQQLRQEESTPAPSPEPPNTQPGTKPVAKPEDTPAGSSFAAPPDHTPLDQAPQPVFTSTNALRSPWTLNGDRA